MATTDSTAADHLSVKTSPGEKGFWMERNALKGFAVYKKKKR